MKSLFTFASMLILFMSCSKSSFLNQEAPVFNPIPTDTIPIIVFNMGVTNRVAPDFKSYYSSNFYSQKLLRDTAYLTATWDTRTDGGITPHEMVIKILPNQSIQYAISNKEVEVPNGVNMVVWNVKIKAIHSPNTVFTFMREYFN